MPRHWKDRTPRAPTAPTPITGSIEKNTATLFFNQAHPELVEGMAVTGPGLDDAMTERGRHQGDAVILQITTDKKSVILSQVANRTSTSETFTSAASTRCSRAGAATALLLARAGLRIESVYGGADLSPFTDASDTMVVVAKLEGA